MLRVDVEQINGWSIYDILESCGYKVTHIPFNDQVEIFSDPSDGNVVFIERQSLYPVFLKREWLTNLDSIYPKIKVRVEAERLLPQPREHFPF